MPDNLDATKRREKVKRNLQNLVNVRLPEWKPPAWHPDKVETSLEQLRQYTEEHAHSAIEWYYSHKTWKATLSGSLRAFTIAATALGGLVPILATSGLFTAPNATPLEVQLRNAQVSQLGYLAIGLAALALAFDRFFGVSTGWMRYISAAMSLETALEQFRFDWAKMTIPLAGKIPEGADLEGLLKRIADFNALVRTTVENETKQWISEFQTNLADLEKETKAAIEQAKAQAEKVQREADTLKDSSRPGAIDLTVENGDQTDAGYDVHVDDGPTRKGSGKTCALTNIPSGIRRVSIVGKIGGDDARGETVASVQTASVVKASVTLVKLKSATA